MAHGASRVSLPTLVGQLLHDGVALARAEVALARVKLTTRLAAAKSGIVLLAVAALLALLALIGLTFGCVLALATLVGPGLAGLIVAGVLLLVAGLLGWFGVRQLSTRPEAAAESLPTPRTTTVEAHA